MSRFHLPVLTDRSVSEAHANRLAGASAFEAKVMGEGGVSCTTKCASCCHYPLTISILDGISLFQWLTSHHLWSSKLRTKLQTHKDQTWDIAPEIWMLSMIPCPLLTEDKLCSVYEARPFLCRTVFSRGDPHYCHPHRLGANLSGILNRTTEVEALWKAERKLLKRHQLKPVLLPISTALLLGERISKGEITIEDTNNTLFEEFSKRP